MKSLMTSMFAAIAAATPSYAATAGAEGHGVLMTVFLALAALIIVMQVVPAVTLFVGLIKGLFSLSHAPRKEETKSV